MTDVVITGRGIICPAGRGVADAWQGILSAKSAAAPHPTFTTDDTPVTLVCQAPEFDPDAEFGRGTSRRLDRYTHLAMVAAAEALADAGLLADGDDAAFGGGLVDEVDRDRVGMLLGSGIGGAETWASEYPNYLERGPRRVSPMFIPKMLSNTAAGVLSMRSGARGPNMTVNTACAAGASAMHIGRDLIRSGQADLVIAGGVEAGITGLAMSAFAQMGALTKNDDPGSASRPFDVDRDGFVMGEGAGIVVLERAADAEARGATIHGRLVGAGASADAHHMTAPPEDGGGAILSMQRALADAGFDPGDIDHINAHGTSTPLNDKTEARAVREVFGDHRPALASTKGVTGHLLGAAGAVEAIFALQSIATDTVPATANTATVDPEIDADVVIDAARSQPVGAVMSNSFGFGGQNASLVFTA
ncbi:beta-ketoacyl-[acyl-carrier-protein] synthase family protein [Salsipaludibacter albus]|uniref:beta-ketoacyl-[acyl-carrier-protein] synthase family protein n=1 Tax=Salsipaludibacter albus TaxID=2849650 RepID=UPI001EE401A3|nr:beta-ketoacyl-[acyl-carrier-protein] synthase family protein [Salsipaludibacter albus]MBY5164209.1 beta-ketoacyl-[acyl-carrier-protein] synthase family protein [Salsipaludibacter albus]